jgi:hypothetical protein
MNTQLRKHTLRMNTTLEKNYVNNTLEGPASSVNHGSKEETQPEQGGICQAAWGVMDSRSSVGDSGCGTITGELPQAAPLPRLDYPDIASTIYHHASLTMPDPGGFFTVTQSWASFTKKLVRMYGIIQSERCCEGFPENDPRIRLVTNQTNRKVFEITKLGTPKEVVDALSPPVFDALKKAELWLTPEDILREQGIFGSREAGITLGRKLLGVAHTVRVEGHPPIWAVGAWDKHLCFRINYRFIN